MKKSSKEIEPYIPNPNSVLSPPEIDELLSTLQTRFGENMGRHEGLSWDDVASRLASSSQRLWSLNEMERTGGEPDVIGRDEATGAYLFCDCAPQSPAGRRSICYDQAGLAEREKKGVYPRGSAVGMAETMGVELLTEAQYRALQALGAFDTTTSSWIRTPPEIRKRGGAIFADFRYGRIFVYHNSAPSFYGARGFRGLLRV